MIEQESVKCADLLAAVKFVDQLVLKADGMLNYGTTPFWHGWALRDAFLAGIAWERQKEKHRSNLP